VSHDKLYPKESILKALLNSLFGKEVSEYHNHNSKKFIEAREYSMKAVKEILEKGINNFWVGEILEESYLPFS
jgi:hypothetical protein